MPKTWAMRSATTRATGPSSFNRPTTPYSLVLSRSKQGFLGSGSFSSGLGLGDVSFMGLIEEEYLRGLTLHLALLELEDDLIHLRLDPKHLVSGLAKELGDSSHFRRDEQQFFCGIHGGPTR